MRKLMLPFLLALTACPGPFWSKICLGGTQDQSNACIVADGTYIAILGGTPTAVCGAHTLNHDPYDAVTAALKATDAGSPDAGTLDAGAQVPASSPSHDGG
jgi:hypothetical protein